MPKGQGDGIITASELTLYLREEVEVEAAQRANLEQTPQLWPLNKHCKGEYIFLVPGQPLSLPGGLGDPAWLAYVVYAGPTATCSDQAGANPPIPARSSYT